MKECVRVQCLHHRRLFRECLLSILESRQFVVRAADHSTWDFRKQLYEWRPDVILIDLNLPERLTVEIAQHVKTYLEGVKVVVLVPPQPTDPYDKQKILDCIEAGANGYLCEQSSLDELTQAIDSVLAGATFCSPRIVDSMFAELAQFAREARGRRRVESTTLTQRELEVLSWVAEGLSNKQIAKRLSLSLYTIKNHIHRILEKLQVHDRFAAAKRAVDNEWLLPTNAYDVA